MRKQVLKSGLRVMIAWACLSSVVTKADETTGAIKGTLATGSASEAVLVDLNRGLEKTTSIADDGNFRFSNLQPGEYMLKVTTADGVLEEEVSVGIGGTVSVVLSNNMTEELTVLGTKRSVVDMSVAESGLVISADQLAEIPVPRDLNSVALLAPGVTLGDQSFDDYESYASFSGSSVAENAFYINGLNTTNFRNGLGFSQVPFEFYESIQVKTGGYSAKFGRSTGGVVNAVSRSGSNNFKAGANVYYSANTSTSPDTKWDENSKDERVDKDFDLWVSGALVPDRVFFYGLYSRTTEELEYYKPTEQTANFDGFSTDFWGVKLDGYITSDHLLSLTAFSDERSVEGDQYSYVDGETGGLSGNSFDERGGINWVATYEGTLTDWLTLSVSHGENEANRTVQGTTDALPVVYWYEGGFQTRGDWVNFLVEVGEDKREMNRIDFSINLENHYIEFGFDQEINTSDAATINSGGAYWLLDPLNEYNGCTPTECPSGANVRLRTYSNGGSFEVNSTAFYIQDQWDVTDRVMLELGIRNESFKNLNGEGESFIEIDNQWAPRASVSWDVTGDGTHKLFANYGLYYLPIAANTNIRMAGSETYIHDFYDWDGDCLNDDYTPCNLGATPYQTDVLGDGSVPDTRSLVDQNVEPMYQSEFILGYVFETDFDWTFGIKGTYREMESAIEDVAIDAAVIDYYNTEGNWTVEGATVEEVFSGFHQYVLTNPGADMDVYIPETDEFISLSADSLGYPEATRKYTALEFSFTRVFADRWTLDGSYVWSHNWGNHEGYVKSDNGQTDAGITTSFDQPGLTDGSYGNLPNDRRHTLKARGFYEFASGLRLGTDFTYQTGRPINCIGVHPTDEFAQQYGAESFYCDGELVPRGTKGTTDDIFVFNANIQYTFEFERSELLLSFDVFNLFDNDGVTEVRELGETDGGEPDPDYGAATRFQAPQGIRLGARYIFD